MRETAFLDLRKQIGRLVTSNYDITDRCNLRCEGCLFFAGDDYKKYRSSGDIETWQKFFRSENERGINFGYFAGAEPSLELGRLRAAHEHIARGVVFSNGLVKIPDDISYRIHISLWGSENQSLDLRGAGIQKALRNYENDDRAVFVVTVTSTSVETLYDVSKSISDYGGIITFNLFSPTTKYLAEHAVIEDSDKQYFRRSHAVDSPILSDSDIARATEQILRAKRDFPTTVVYSTYFHNWLTRPGGLYQLDPVTGIAMNCGNRLSERHRHYNVDLSATEAKCCSPNIDCSQCRAYAQSYATFLKEKASPRLRPAISDEWLEVWRIWARLFIGEQPPERPIEKANDGDIINARE
jgi:hypothetical protein